MKFWRQILLWIKQTGWSQVPQLMHVQYSFAWLCYLSGVKLVTLWIYEVRIFLLFGVGFFCCCFACFFYLCMCWFFIQVTQANMTTKISWKKKILFPLINTVLGSSEYKSLYEKVYQKFRFLSQDFNTQLSKCFLEKVSFL